MEEKDLNIEEQLEREEQNPEARDLHTEEFLVNMGPQHPSTHGVCRLQLTMDGEVIVKVEPYIGYLHRAIEKICENRVYNQITPFMDRFEYVSSMLADWVYALCMERIGQIEVSPRAEHLRIIFGELQRIASHLIYWGVFGMDLGAFTPFLYGLREREMIMDLFEETCGQRLTYNYIRIGGVSQDIKPGFEQKCRKFTGYMRQVLEDYEALLNENPIFLSRTKGIGIAPPDLSIAYGVSGPSLRASGVNWDVRKDDPYGYYDKFEFDIPKGRNYDTWDRYQARVIEMRESTKLIDQALEGLPEGDPTFKVRASFKLPEGEHYARIESSRGEMGCYIVSQGEKKPYRLKLRGSSFNNLMIIPEISKGLKIADLVAIFASYDIVMPEVDR
ncbi:MAG: NADH-quinone oxidoreductase subunit D [candidate division Zixibacteria bacterium]|nr:NADH-quinone oxidoreductase subunit D [candidate division Zixibacteria bacterium]NIR63682.1 NADH-quinone oxidoreductase subunit D [candidate division Zixibacteria bacterium]NIS18333.1 NADH-quinone oxidoreductase subunit D [candidate division Zixibacteria bacterium]NIS45635.1 NADH-quinone oxidoreductase subunit D [candidate division Zixibacteria bacterium]NIT54660.1 NADH-quinone oxidoreductase subunit D [candidate division Zixibacteria bacterium]